MFSKLDPNSTAASRGWSDLTIRNMFIIPTIVFLIVFNIFPLIYSLGYSFTDFRASVNEPAKWVGLQNYRELLSDPNIWRNFTVTAHYVIVSVAGQVVVGFGIALLLNRAFALKGFVTTLLLLPMMMSMAVVGLFWKLLYDPSWGPINYVLKIGNFEWLSDPDMALYAIAITDIWMWAPFVMLLSLAGLSAVPQHLYEAAAIDRAGTWYTFTRITLPLVSPILLIAITYSDMSDNAFPFLAAREIDIGYANVLAIRITYVGELGWELHVPAIHAVQVYDQLVEAGAEFGLRHAGMQTLNSLRLEKAYRDFGVDVDNTDNPIEAGLGFAVKLDKEGGFIGRDALAAIKDKGVPHNRMLQFLLDDPEPLLYGNELIYLDGQQVGHLQVGGYGHTLGGAVGIGFATLEEPLSAEIVNTGKWEIDVAGVRYKAQASLRPLLDPKMERIKC